MLCPLTSPSPNLPHLLCLTSLENLKTAQEQAGQATFYHRSPRPRWHFCISVDLAYHTHFMEDTTTAQRNPMTGPGPNISEVTEAGLEHQSLFRWSWTLSLAPPPPHRSPPLIKKWEGKSVGGGRTGSHPPILAFWK